METGVIGIDIAKTVFHLVGIDEKGRETFRKKSHRTELLGIIANIPKCVIAMEACGGANYWSREFEKLGFEVRLLPAKYVKAYLKANKNDWNDAAAIAEASSRGTMHFVSPRTLYQQDLQCLHRKQAEAT